MVAKAKAKGRASVRLPEDLVERADAYAGDNRDGFKNRQDVTAQALREFLERKDQEKRRREMFDAWTAGGRKWPPPPGLDVQA